MNLIKAIIAMNSGRKVRRPIWPENQYAIIDGNGLMWVCTKGSSEQWVMEPHLFMIDDIIAKDWKIV